MPQISAAKSPVRKKDRLLGAFFAGGKTMLLSFARTFYVLWLQATGLFFIVFTVMGSAALIRQYGADHFADRHRLWITLGFTVVSAWFTLISFNRAKKTSRRR